MEPSESAPLAACGPGAKFQEDIGQGLSDFALPSPYLIFFLFFFLLLREQFCCFVFTPPRPGQAEVAPSTPLHLRTVSVVVVSAALLVIRLFYVVVR